MSTLPWQRRLGATPLDDERTEFRVWAPRAQTLALRLGRGRRAREVELTHASHGIFETVAEAPPGTDYAYRIGGRVFPDPASRWQPDGLRGPSRVYRPRAPAPGRRSRPLRDHVIYELHVGTFSPEGTFRGAIPHLAALAELGVTMVEVMPVAEFPGARGWGYDGVYLSAAQSSYGGPEALQDLVDAAHEHGLSIILDVVYNHVGTSGTKAIEAFGPYFTERYDTPWGRALNYDDAGCDPVREWACQSAVGWIADFGFDGLRLDAIHAIFDSSPEHVVAELSRRVHEADPRALVIAESGLNDPRVVRAPADGGWGCDGTWADDFHHSLRTLLTGDRDGYYADYGTVEQFAKAWSTPYVFDGVYSPFRDRVVGAPATGLAPERFVVFAQNHDQVGNRAFGDRLPRAARPLAALCVLLSPFTPMLFMGEEYGENAPFQFFTDHIDRRIAEATRTGRRQEFAAFASFGQEIPDPQDEATFTASKLTRVAEAAIARLYRELLRLRPELPAGLPDAVSFDEERRWLRVTRGPYEIVTNFGAAELSQPTHAREILVATDGAVDLRDGEVRLPPLGGAVLR
jgi:maltooligosyltrehalose trehalohydrolase